MFMFQPHSLELGELRPSCPPNLVTTEQGAPLSGGAEARPGVGAGTSAAPLKTNTELPQPAETGRMCPGKQGHGHGNANYAGVCGQLPRGQVSRHL